jgi:hypothetical protein
MAGEKPRQAGLMAMVTHHRALLQDWLRLVRDPSRRFDQQAHQVMTQRWTMHRTRHLEPGS